MTETTNPVASRLTAITERLRGHLQSEQDCFEGLSAKDECVSAEAVRESLRSLDALIADMMTGVEVLEPNIPNRTLTMALVAKTVSNVFEVPLADFITPYRLKKRNVQAQRATAHLIRKHIPIRSLPEIASFMRKRDHSTLHHCIKVARIHLRRDVEFANLVSVAEHRLMSHA